MIRRPNPVTGVLNRASMNGSLPPEDEDVHAYLNFQLLEKSSKLRIAGYIGSSSLVTAIVGGRMWGPVWAPVCHSLHHSLSPHAQPRWPWCESARVRCSRFRRAPPSSLAQQTLLLTSQSGVQGGGVLLPHGPPHFRCLPFCGSTMPRAPALLQFPERDQGARRGSGGSCV